MDLSRYDKKTQELIEECERLTVIVDSGALRCLRRLKRLARELEDQDLLGFVYFYYANWYYDNSQYEKFQKSLEQAIEALLRSDAYELLSRAYNFFAIDAQNNDALDVAYSYYMNALQFAEMADDKNVIGIATHNLATFYYWVGDYSTARKYFRKSAKLLENNKENSFYYRNLLIAYISEGVSSLGMGDTASADLAFKKVSKIHKVIPESHFRDVRLSYEFFKVRLALAEEDREAVNESLKVIMKILRDEFMPFVEMSDIRDFCYDMIKYEEWDMVGELLELVEPRVMQENVTHAMCMLVELEIEYYDKVNDKHKLMEALKQQHVLLQRQREEKTKIFQYSMNLINLVSDLHREEIEVREENMHLQIQIMTDELTGIPNRYALDQEMSAAFERAYGVEGLLGVGIMDVDEFKAFNDNYGHQAGDVCLEQIGAILKEISEEKGVYCARYGGDEFVVIYEDKSDAEILEIAKEIETRVRECKLVNNGVVIEEKLSISQGICNDAPRIKSKPWDFLAEADDALYSKKGHKREAIPVRRLPDFG